VNTAKIINEQYENKEVTEKEKYMSDRFPIVKILSDYTPSDYDQANYLHVIMDEDNDIHFSTQISNDRERGIRIAMSGTRYSNEFRNACRDFYKACLKEIQETNRDDLIECNPYVKKCKHQYSTINTWQQPTTDGDTLYWSRTKCFLCGDEKVSFR